MFAELFLPGITTGIGSESCDMEVMNHPGKLYKVVLYNPHRQPMIFQQLPYLLLYESNSFIVKLFYDIFTVFVAIVIIIIVNIIYLTILWM
jgi:hypothetical protein